MHVAQVLKLKQARKLSFGARGASLLFEGRELLGSGRPPHGPVRRNQSEECGGHTVDT